LSSCGVRSTGCASRSKPRRRSPPPWRSTDAPRRMGRSGVVVSLVALLVGVLLGAAPLSWWEGGRQSAEIETLKVRLADERGQVQAKIKQLTDELRVEKQRRAAVGTGYSA